jgi:hypothetical protein
VSARRRRRNARLLVWAVVAIAAAGCSDGLSAAARAQGGDDRYWDVADRLQRTLEPRWSEHDGLYVTHGSEAAINGQMLVTHALAALHGHDGPARRDGRARAIARRLTASPPYLPQLPPRPWDSMTHAPGWSAGVDNLGGLQHPVFETQIVGGLAAAWRARRALGLDRSVVKRIEREIGATAAGAFYRWPALRLNQFNWNTDLQAAAATVTGSTSALRRDLPRFMRDFVARVGAGPGWAGNLGAGLRFHYNPRTPLNDPHNVESAEYANVVWTFAQHYGAARRAGMPRPSQRVLRLFREWGRRVVAGYWTHGGYLNWDTGFGFKRWHQAKKLGLAQGSLIGLATSRELEPSSRRRRWAKWLLDRTFWRYLTWSDECSDGLPPPLLFGVHADPQRPCDAVLAAARVQANAARAADAGLGRLRSERPPALYAFDPDTGRLAVTTPSYNTAVMVVNQRAFPYGGLDIARLFDGDQEVAASIGGRPPASFGLIIRRPSGTRSLATQLGWPRVRLDVTPLRLLEAPRGARASASAAPRRALAGPFRRLRATGTMRSGGFYARVTHRFTPDWIQTRWDARRRTARGPHSADVLFPSWGGQASVTLRLADGRAIALDAERRPLPAGAWLHVRSVRSGYAVLPLGRHAGATVRLLHPRPQRSAPLAGPTLAVGLGAEGRDGRRSFAVRLATVDAGTAPEPVAAALGRGG